MSVSLRCVWSVMKEILPLQYAEKWYELIDTCTCRDNVGLLLSPLNEKVIDGKVKILLCNDIVDSVESLFPINW